jgi:hypothetical protein
VVLSRLTWVCQAPLSVAGNAGQCVLESVAVLREADKPVCALLVVPQVSPSPGPDAGTKSARAERGLADATAFVCAARGAFRQGQAGGSVAAGAAQKDVSPMHASTSVEACNASDVAKAVLVQAHDECGGGAEARTCSSEHIHLLCAACIGGQIRTWRTLCNCDGSISVAYCGVLPGVSGSVAATALAAVYHTPAPTRCQVVLPDSLGAAEEDLGIESESAVPLGTRWVLAACRDRSVRAWHLGTDAFQVVVPTADAQPSVEAAAPPRSDLPLPGQVLDATRPAGNEETREAAEVLSGGPMFQADVTTDSEAGLSHSQGEEWCRADVAAVAAAKQLELKQQCLSRDGATMQSCGTGRAAEDTQAVPKSAVQQRESCIQTEHDPAWSRAGKNRGMALLVPPAAPMPRLSKHRPRATALGSHATLQPLVDRALSTSPSAGQASNTSAAAHLLPCQGEASAAAVAYAALPCLPGTLWHATAADACMHNIAQNGDVLHAMAAACPASGRAADIRDAHSRALPLLWQGDIVMALEVVVQANALNADFVAIAAAAGPEVWRATVLVHAAQLATTGDTHLAVMYLCAAKAFERAVEAYVQAGLLLEALLLAERHLPLQGETVTALRRQLLVKLEQSGVGQEGRGHEWVAAILLAVGDTHQVVMSLTARTSRTSLRCAAAVALAADSEQFDNLAAELSARALLMASPAVLQLEFLRGDAELAASAWTQDCNVAAAVRAVGSTASLLEALFAGMLAACCRDSADAVVSLVHGLHAAAICRELVPALGLPAASLAAACGHASAGHPSGPAMDSTSATQPSATSLGAASPVPALIMGFLTQLTQALGAMDRAALSTAAQTCLPGCRPEVLKAVACATAVPSIGDASYIVDAIAKELLKHAACCFTTSGASGTSPTGAADLSVGAVEPEGVQGGCFRESAATSKDLANFVAALEKLGQSSQRTSCTPLHDSHSAAVHALHECAVQVLLVCAQHLVATSCALCSGSQLKHLTPRDAAPAAGRHSSAVSGPEELPRDASELAKLAWGQWVASAVGGLGYEPASCALNPVWCEALNARAEGGSAACQLAKAYSVKWWWQADVVVLAGSNNSAAAICEMEAPAAREGTPADPEACSDTALDQDEADILPQTRVGSMAMVELDALLSSQDGGCMAGGDASSRVVGAAEEQPAGLTAEYVESFQRVEQAPVPCDWARLRCQWRMAGNTGLPSTGSVATCELCELEQEGAGSPLGDALPGEVDLAVGWVNNVPVPGGHADGAVVERRVGRDARTASCQGQVEENLIDGTVHVQHRFVGGWGVSADDDPVLAAWVQTVCSHPSVESCNN